jgi:hypothetical protein
MRSEAPEQSTSEGSSATVGLSDEAPGTTRRFSVGRWSWPLNRVALTAYLIVLSVYIVRVGVPTDRIGQTGWILIGIVAARLGRPLRDHARAVLDWLPLLAALILYDHTRGFADTLGMPVRITELVDVERSMFGGILPTAWLQENFSDPADPRWWDAIASLVYTSHFVLPWALAAVLYVRSRPLWWTYVNRVVLLSYAGLATYILLPAAPPWYAARYGFVTEEIDRVISNGWAVLGLRSAGALLEEAQAGSNPIAALPSLHAAFAVLVSVTLWTVVRNRALRVLIAAYPVAMAMTLVYGGEHYFVDVLLGWVYVGVVLVVAIALDGRRSVGATDAAQQIAGADEVVGPDEEKVLVGHGAERAADADAVERDSHGLELVGRARGDDGAQEPVLGPARFGGGPAAERPLDDEQ